MAHRRGERLLEVCWSGGWPNNGDGAWSNERRDRPERPLSVSAQKGSAPRNHRCNPDAALVRMPDAVSLRRSRIWRCVPPSCASGPIGLGLISECHLGYPHDECLNSRQHVGKALVVTLAYCRVLSASKPHRRRAICQLRQIEADAGRLALTSAKNNRARGQLWSRRQTKKAQQAKSFVRTFLIVRGSEGRKLGHSSQG